jgi:hypothetical protein
MKKKKKSKIPYRKNSAKTQGSVSGVVASLAAFQKLKALEGMYVKRTGYTEEIEKWLESKLRPTSRFYIPDPVVCFIL